MVVQGQEGSFLFLGIPCPALLIPARSSPGILREQPAPFTSLHWHGACSGIRVSTRKEPVISRRALWLLFLIELVLSGITPTEGQEEHQRPCGLQASPRVAQSASGVGGKYLTASGTLKVLIVFVSFPDDETPHPYWPAHAPPLYMDEFIDPDTSTHTHSALSLTDYFQEMSLGQFHVVGKSLWVETPHSQTEYLNGSYGRANWSVLQERVDSLVDFSQYDNWTNSGPYENTHTPDGLVDMIIMVWRTTLFEYLGEASLGYKTGFTVDGKRIEMGFPEHYEDPVGSGVTCEYPYGDDPVRLRRTAAHELGHWLLGGPHPYNGTTLEGKHQYWGLLCAGQRVSSCVNAYEREQLGWIVVPELPPDGTTLLKDYCTTGAARKYHPPNGEVMEYFYFENHQLLSIFDDVTVNPDDRGIWILHQQGPYVEMDNLRIRPSDGSWNWESPGITTACGSSATPLFSREDPNVLTGLSHRDQIPTPTSAVNWMLAYQDPAGNIQCGWIFAGEGFRGAFNRLDPLFSPFTNPNSNTWSNQPTAFALEVVDDSAGFITVRTFSQVLEAPPASRFLGRDPSIPEAAGGPLPLAWGTQWLEGQPLEEDVISSELQRKIGDIGEWTKVYEGAAMSWSDQSLVYDSSGSIRVLFRVRVRDAQMQYSGWSNVFESKAQAPTAASSRPELPLYDRLEENYPNPFNASTVIRYDVAQTEIVKLVIYDLLGRQVEVLVNGTQIPGRHSVRFSGVSLPSGIYFSRLTAGGSIQTKKMILLR
jgi:M6 family metalloprotease-like protein